MSADSNVATAQQMLDAFNSGQVERITDLYAPDGIMHVAGNTATGNFRGHEQIATGLARMYQFFTSGGASMRVGPAESILASDDHVMMFFRAHGERDGARLEGTVVVAATMDPNAKYKELWFITDSGRQAQSLSS